MPNDIVDPGSELDQISPPDLSPAVPPPAPRVSPPPGPVLPPGAGFTYSSQGPADWSETRTFTAPGGLEIPIPRNAVNPTFFQGPPPEDPQTVLVRKALNSVPVDQAWQAIEAAGNFLAGQAFNREYKKQMEAHGDPIKAGQAAMAASASYYTNPEMRRKAMETAGRMGTVTPQLMDVPGVGKVLVNPKTGAMHVSPVVTAPGPVQTQPVLDPSGKPIPGMVGVPGKSGMMARPLPKPATADTSEVKAQRHVLDQQRKALQKVLDSPAEISQRVSQLLAQNPKLKLQDAEAQVRKAISDQIAKLDEQYLAPSKGGSVQRSLKVLSIKPAKPVEYKSHEED